jgi:hypothetical protein
MTSPTTFGLHTVWGTGSTDVYAGGEGGVIIHYDGANWTPVQDADVVSPYSVKSISGSGPSDVWAATSDNRLLHGPAAKWSSTDPCPEPGSFHPEFSALQVFSAGEAIAVHFDQGTICQQRGGIWQPSSLVLQFDSGFQDVWGTGPNDIFVVGSRRLAHFDGLSWSVVVENVSAVALWGSSSTDVWALGGPYGGLKNSGLRYGGSQWSVVSAAPGAVEIWGSGPNDVYAVDTGYSIWHYDGKAWSEIKTQATSSLNAIWGSGPTDVFAVGDKGTILHWTP